MCAPSWCWKTLRTADVRAIVVLENFAHTLEQVIGETGLRKVVTTEIGDMFPTLKRLLTNAVVKHVKKMVPAWRLPGSVRWRDALAVGRAQQLDAVPLGHDDLAFLQYTGGTTGVAKGAHTETWWPTCCRWAHGCRQTCKKEKRR